MMSRLKALFVQVTETGFVFVGFIVLVYLLLGEDAGSYAISVVANLSLLIDALSSQALVAIVLGLALIYLLRRN